MFHLLSGIVCRFSDFVSYAGYYPGILCRLSFSALKLCRIRFRPLLRTNVRRKILLFRRLVIGVLYTPLSTFFPACSNGCSMDAQWVLNGSSTQRHYNLIARISQYLASSKHLLEIDCKYTTKNSYFQISALHFVNKMKFLRFFLAYIIFL